MKSISRILVVTPWYPTPDKPFATTFVKDQTEILFDYFSKADPDTQYKFCVLHLSYPLDIPALAKGKKALRKEYPEFHGKYSVIHEQAVYPSHRIPYGQNFFIKKAIKRGFLKACKTLEDNPDFIIGVTLSGLIDSLTIKETFHLNVPIILHEHSVPITMHLKSSDRKRRAIQALNEARSIIVVADRQIEEVGALVQNKTIEKVWNPAHIDFFNVSIDTKINPSPISLITIGRLSYQKGYERLLRAMKRIEKDLPEVTLQIVGEGEKKEDLKKLTKELNLTGKVEFLGGKSRKDIAHLLKKADIFVLPSRYENCPVVLAEAQAAGLPCICTINNASEHILLPGNGIAVEQDEEGAALGNAILKMSFDIGEYSRNKIRASAHDQFSPDVFGKKFYEIYKTSSKNSKLFE